jgi:hypothetical protein
MTKNLVSGVKNLDPIPNNLECAIKKPVNEVKNLEDVSHNLERGAHNLDGGRNNPVCASENLDDEMENPGCKADIGIPVMPPNPDTIAFVPKATILFPQPLSQKNFSED